MHWKIENAALIISLQSRKGQDSPGNTHICTRVYLMHNERTQTTTVVKFWMSNCFLVSFPIAITRFGLRRHGKVLLGCALAAVSVLWAIQLEVGGAWGGRLRWLLKMGTLQATTSYYHLTMPCKQHQTSTTTKLRKIELFFLGSLPTNSLEDWKTQAMGTVVPELGAVPCHSTHMAEQVPRCPE